MDKKIPVKTGILLSTLHSDLLREFVALHNSKAFEVLQRFYKIFAEIEKDKFLYLQTEDERKLANEIVERQGEVRALKILITVIEGASAELTKRKED